MPKVRSRPGASNLRQGVCKSWSHVENNISWRLGSGKLIRFWLDSWVPNEGPLLNYVTQPSVEMDVECMVNSFFLPSGGWDIAKLRLALPEGIINKITVLHVPMQGEFDDVVIWKPAADGSFSLKSAYDAIAGHSS